VVVGVTEKCPYFFIRLTLLINVYLNNLKNKNMTHTFQTTNSIEVTSFPHYRKYAHFYYKVLSETHEIKISYYPRKELPSAEINYDTIVPNNTFREGSYEITEEEFNETFKLALKEAADQLIKAIKKHKKAGADDTESMELILGYVNSGGKVYLED
jgi:hypothetical protein